MTVGQGIRAARKAAGLKQSELAEKVYVHTNIIQGAESDKHLPRIDTLIRIADALNVSLDTLCGREGNHESPK